MNRKRMGLIGAACCLAVAGIGCGSPKMDMNDMKMQGNRMFHRRVIS